MSATQDQIDKLTAAQSQSSTFISEIAEDVATLQGQISNSGDQATADLLQPLVDKATAMNAALQGIDDETPNPPVEPPAV